MLSHTSSRCYASLPALALAVLCAILLPACDAGGKARVEGDTVHLPKSALLVRMYESIGTSEHPAFVKFGGDYPRNDWPRDFALPGGTHIQYGMKIEPQDPGMNELSTPGTRRAVFTAIAPGKPAEVIQHFKDQVAGQGLELEKDQANPGGESTEFGKSPGTHELSTKWDSDKKIQTLNVRVMLDEDLDGWVMYTVNMVVKTSG